MAKGSIPYSASERGVEIITVDVDLMGRGDGNAEQRGYQHDFGHDLNVRLQDPYLQPFVQCSRS